MNATLDGFFDVMDQLLDGSIDAAGATALLGPCPEGDERLALYAVLVHRQRRAALDGFFRSLSVASDRRKKGTWARIAGAFVRAHPPRTQNPNEWATELLTYLEGRKAHGEDVPDELLEIADYAVIRYRASIEDRVAIRHYDHDIVAFSRAVEAGATDVALAEGPTTVLVGRSRRTNRVVVLDASLAMLVAVARRDDPAFPLPAGVLTELEVGVAEAELAARGLSYTAAPADASA